jgi:putative transposase
MDRKHHTDKEIAEILRELDAGCSIDNIVDKHKLSKATLYRWKKKAQKSDTIEVKRLKQVDEENSRLRSLLADAALEIHALKERISYEHD